MESAARTAERMSLGSPGRTSFNILAPFAVLTLFAALFALRPAMPAPGYIVIVGVLSYAALRWLPFTDFRTFCLYVLAFSLFNGLRTIADETGNPVHFAYPITADKLLFLGAVPTVWLQDRLYEPARMTLLEWSAIGVYVSYFSGHFVFGGILWVVKRELLPTYVAVVALTLALGLAGYFLLPTAPPWLAANAGDLPDVARISALANSEVWADAYERGAYVAGANDVGAMPSLHTALTAVIAMACWRWHRVLGIAGWIYVAVMGLALTYLGEHYVVDVLAGILTAALAWRLVMSGRAGRFARRLTGRLT